MKRKNIFLILGVLSGFIVFWGPTIIHFNKNFSDPILFSWFTGKFPWLLSSWLMPGILYVIASVPLFFAFFYFFSKEKKNFQISTTLKTFTFFAVGLYLSLSMFFLLLGIGFLRGNFGW